MVSLNPEAPEFIPSQHHKLQHVQVQPPPCPTSIFTPQHYCYYYFAISSYPSRDQLHPLYYNPTTTTLPPPFTPFHETTLTNPTHQLAPPEPEPNPVEGHAVLQQQQQKQKKEEGKTGGVGSKGLVQKQVFKAFISCGTLDGPRSDGLSLKAYARRRKCDYLRNRHVTRHPSEQCFRAFPKKKRCYPLLPVKVDGDDTTVMIKNIPSKYTRDMLVEFLEDHCVQVNLRDSKEKGEESSTLAFDFVYLPIDFKSGLNKGYAFVNFTKPQAAWKFLLTASNMKWGLFQSHKIREVVSARLQGKEKLERHFETMNFPCESDDVLPVCFSPPRDGVIKGEQRTMGKLIKREQV